MKRLEFICDGCDFSDACDVPPSGNVSDYMMNGWVSHHVVAEEDGRRVNEVLVDLCPTCSEKYRTIINPMNWGKTNTDVIKLVSQQEMSRMIA